jgi:hypothetical protein
MSATVSPPKASGNVTFYEGTTPLGTAALSSGTAFFSTILLPAGNRKLKAYYGGDTTYDASTSNTISQTVLAAAGNIFAAGPTPLVPHDDTEDLVVVADFNRDGKADLAITSSFTALTILLGNGDGSFQSPIRYPTLQCYLCSMAVGDFNDDGNPDLAVSNGSNVAILLGTGDGTFQPAAIYPLIRVGSAPINGFKLAIRDFNGDGNSDVLVVSQNGIINQFSGNVSVLLGNGDGTLQPVVNYPFSTLDLPHPYLAAVGDFDGDGNPDLVIGSYIGIVGSYNSANLCVQLGKGDGTFQAAGCFAGGEVTSIAVYDLNGDGKDDLVVGSQDPNAVSILLANGDGTFTADTHALVYYPGFIAPGDFNGDGKTDLVIVSQHGGLYGVGSITLMLGNDDGTFPASIDYDYSQGVYPSSVVVGDFNGDGRADLVTISDLQTYFPVRVWLGVLASISATGGTPQSTSPGQPFAAALQATVLDSAGNPVEGATVTFAAPAAGASARIPNFIMTTDAAGVATAFATANGVAGSYMVTASIGLLNATFSLTNGLATPGGSAALPGTDDH